MLQSAAFRRFQFVIDAFGFGPFFFSGVAVIAFDDLRERKEPAVRIAQVSSSLRALRVLRGEILFLEIYSWSGRLKRMVCFAVRACVTVTLFGRATANPVKRHKSFTSEGRRHETDTLGFGSHTFVDRDGGYGRAAFTRQREKWR